MSNTTKHNTATPEAPPNTHTPPLMVAFYLWWRAIPPGVSSAPPPLTDLHDTDGASPGSTW